MTMIELPRRRAEPRMFVEADPGLHRHVDRALAALGNLPEDLELPGLDMLAGALIEIADALERDADLEPEDDADGEEEALPLLAFHQL